MLDLSCIAVSIPRAITSTTSTRARTRSSKVSRLSSLLNFDLGSRCRIIVVKSRRKSPLSTIGIVVVIRDLVDGIESAVRILMRILVLVYRAISVDGGARGSSSSSMVRGD